MDKLRKITGIVDIFIFAATTLGSLEKRLRENFTFGRVE